MYSLLILLAMIFDEMPTHSSASNDRKSRQLYHIDMLRIDALWKRDFRAFKMQ